MKALTVQQPWAWAIVHGGKDVENRTQAWSYRGPLAIHAGARWSERGGAVMAGMAAIAAEIDPLGNAFDDLPPIGREGYTFGAIVGVVNLVDAHLPDQSVPCCTSPWAEMQAGVHLVLANPRPLAEPIPCRGRLGLWTPDDILTQLGAAL